MSKHVFLAHGASGSAASMRPYVQGLKARGLDASAVQLPRGPAERAMPAYLALAGVGADVFIGGQSFGGRVASLLAAERRYGGLILFSYPLHRPGFPDQLRTAHWPQVRCPVLLLEGDADPFATPAILEREVEKLADHRLVVYPRARHGLKGKDLEEALDRVAEFVHDH